MGQPEGLPALFNTTGTGTGGESLAQWQAQGKDALSIAADPNFKGGSHAPPLFVLDPASPAIAQQGFMPIDLSTVGPRSVL